MSAPETVFVLVRVTGEYSDRQEAVIGFVRTEDEAKRAVQTASEEARTAMVSKPESPSWDEQSDKAWEAYEARIHDWIEDSRSAATIDPEGVDEYDRPYYHYAAASLIGGEA